MRLNKWLVLAGVATSRRKADELIAEGRIVRNGHVAEAGVQAQPYDDITLDGENLRITSDELRLIALYKPRGVISSHVRQGKNNKIIADFVPLGWQHDIIVGRLDRESEGLVLLTNDGALAHQLMHPSFGVRREYLVTTQQPLNDLQISLLTDGVELEDGISKAVKATKKDGRRIRIVLEEGRNRQIRRTLAELGHTVTRLVRVKHGDFSLEDLEPGEWRELNIEVQA
jgi:pseudouridine synthase